MKHYLFLYWNNPLPSFTYLYSMVSSFYLLFFHIINISRQGEKAEMNNQKIELTGRIVTPSDPDYNSAREE